jgi:CRP-like cAMP-binding protein
LYQIAKGKNNFTDRTGRKMIKIAEKFKAKKLLHFRKNQVIIDSKKHAEGVFIILSGKVKIIKNEGGLPHRGEGKFLCYAFKNQILGLAEIIQKEKPSYDVIAEQDVDIYFIPENDFVNTLKEDKSLMIEVMQKFCKQITHVEEQTIKNESTG